MPDNVSRGCVEFTIPDYVGENSLLVANNIKNLYDIYNILVREWNAINVIRSNPYMWNNPQHRLGTSEDAPVSSNLSNNQTIRANHLNTLKSYINNKFNYNISNVDINNKYNTNDMNNLITAIRNINNTVAEYNSWWKSNDYCGLSCQVRCQYACQLACQGCNNGTCHNQNCGGWS